MTTPNTRPRIPVDYDTHTFNRAQAKGNAKAEYERMVDLGLWLLARRNLREIRALCCKQPGDDSAALARMSGAQRSLKAAGMPEHGKEMEGGVARSRARRARTTLEPLTALPSGPVLPSPDPAPADDAAQAPDMP